MAAGRVKTYLGVDGGGSKTQFVLIDEQGAVLAQHQEGSAYYPEIGIAALHALLQQGMRVTLALGGVAPEALAQAFLGLPAFGEDSQLLARLNAMGAPLLRPEQFSCGNDMVCGWAGALACGDGINIVCGTGSIAYGEFAGRSARAGGWGELFSDEGSAYWVAREGLALFSRMSDGRAPKGPLHGMLRDHFALADDLDLCAAIYGSDAAGRSRIAQLAHRVADAAHAGDRQCQEIFRLGARELAAIIHATRARLQVPEAMQLDVSYSGGMFSQTALLLEPLRQILASGTTPYRLIAPLLPPAAGAALYAARRSGYALGAAAVEHLAAQSPGASTSAAASAP